MPGVGVFHERMPQLCYRLARLHPDCSSGRCCPLKPPPRLRSLPNMHSLGEIRYTNMNVVTPLDIFVCLVSQTAKLSSSLVLHDSLFWIMSLMSWLPGSICTGISRGHRPHECKPHIIGYYDLCYQAVCLKGLVSYCKYQWNNLSAFLDKNIVWRREIRVEVHYPSVFLNLPARW